MSMAVIGGSVAGAVVTGYMGQQAAESQASAMRDAAKTADPFGPQRGFYQNILRNLYGGMGGGGGAVAAQPTGVMQTAMQMRPDYYAHENYDSFASERGRRQLERGLATGSIPGANFVMPSTGQAPGTITAQGAGGGGMDSGVSPIQQFIQSSPEYQFRFNEGQRALERSASARGMLNSGNILRDLTTFGQNQASQAYSSEINRIMTMAGATIGSPSVAAQIQSNAAGVSAQGQNQMAGAIGYGVGQIAQNWNNAGNWANPNTQSGMINSQTGYTGGVSGVLSGDEWANF